MSELNQYLIFDTHPIQYRTPLFSQLDPKLGSGKVYYFDRSFDGKKPWFHEYDKIPKQDFKEALPEGFSAEFLDLAGKSFFSKSAKLYKLLSHGNVQGVLIFGWYLPEHWILWALCLWRRIPLSFVGETFNVGTGWRKVLKGVLHPLFFKGVNKVISVGNKTEAFYRSINIAESKIVKAKYCVNTDFFVLDKLEAKRLRGKTRRVLGIYDSSFLLLFVGRLFDRKRPFDMVRLHKALSDKNVYTVLAGNGELEQPLRTATHDLCGIHCLGFQNQKQVRSLYYAADLLVVPSEYETWGLIVNEAFACGLPALVTDTCGVANDLVIPDETGFVYQKGNIDEAVFNVRKMTDSIALRERLSHNAKQKVSSEYRLDQMATALQSALRPLTSSH